MDYPKRILHMIGSLNVGGSQAVVLNLYRAIDRSKIQFDFIIDKPDETELVPVVEALGARVYTLPSFKGKNIKEVTAAWETFLNNHQEYKVLHSHVRSYASLYFPIAKRHGLKTIIHSHSTSNGKGPTALIKNALQLPLRYQADYFLSCSDEAGRWLFGSRIVHSSKYHLLQNAIDISRYTPDISIRNRIREKLGLEGSVVFIHVGRLHPAKNHEFLLKVFSEVSLNNKTAKLLIVGDGELREDITKQIQQYGLTGSVFMLGSRNDVPDLLRAADCFLFPSLWEGLPVTVVEAQASGLPCLVSDHVTNDVFVSDLAIKMPIDNGSQVWSQRIQTLSFERKDVTDSIRRAGFDISETAKWITQLYLNMC